jgi:DNA-binding PadR family transcriptional regulator
MAMTPLTYQILLSVTDAARHGYGIIKEIEEREGKDAAPSTGALYLALQRLERDGLIDGVDAPGAEADPRRRYYRITKHGRNAASIESVRLAKLVSAARAKKLLEKLQPESGS